MISQRRWPSLVKIRPEHHPDRRQQRQLSEVIPSASTNRRLDQRRARAPASTAPGHGSPGATHREHERRSTA
jgi:hypothetical protein